jgi:hypothetical protein
MEDNNIIELDNDLGDDDDDDDDIVEIDVNNPDMYRNPHDVNRNHYVDFTIMMSRILQNDPLVTSLTVGNLQGLISECRQRYKPTGDLGRAISVNKHLEQLTLFRCMPSDELSSFFTGIGSNRSIKMLEVVYCEDLNDSMMNYWTPFLENNHTFESMEIAVFDCYGTTDSGISSLLQMFDYLKVIKLNCDETNISNNLTLSNQTDIILESLIGHTGLMKIELGNIEIGIRGIEALGSILQNPSCNLKALHINCATMNDEGADVLAIGLTNNHSLTELELDIHGITDVGWQAIIIAVQNTRCRLEKLHLHAGLNRHRSNINEDYIAAALLHHSTTLKKVSDEGWLVISQLLLVPNSVLEELTLCITNEQIEDVSTVLAQNCTLRKLNLYTSTESINMFSFLMEEVDQRWLDFSDVLRNPSSALESLSLGVNIDDTIMNSFTDVLVTNSRLKRLSLYGNNSITTEGWVTFSAFLHNPNSNLEELQFESNHINDTVINSFADALTINSKLRDLKISLCDDYDDDDNDDDDNDPNPLADNIITSMGYDALTCMLCNNRSILSTFNSNHSLEKIILEIFAYDEDNDEDEEEQIMAKLPEELKTLLQINKENYKSQAARLKIINTHFSGNDINMEPFMKMDVDIRPHAIGWMAKDMHVYQFLRAMPSLLEKVEDEGHMVG